MVQIKTRFSFSPVNRAAGKKKQNWMMAVLFFFCLALTILYHGMRGVLDLGGFVASGGPYAIAHPAPGWIWIMPVSAILMVATLVVGVNVSIASGFHGSSLMIFSWSAVFISLGWNFLDYGIGFGEKTGPVWSWLVCAFFFMLMGLIPLYFILRNLVKKMKEGKRERPAAWIPSLLFQVFLVVVAIAGGGALFRLVSR